VLIILISGDPPDTDIPEGPYPTWVTSPSGKKIPILHSSAFTKYLGKVYLRFSKNGDLEEIEGNPILLDSSIPKGGILLKYYYTDAGINDSLRQCVYFPPGGNQFL